MFSRKHLRVLETRQQMLSQGYMMQAVQNNLVPLIPERYFTSLQAPVNFSGLGWLFSKTNSSQLDPPSCKNAVAKSISVIHLTFKSALQEIFIIEMPISWLKQTFSRRELIHFGKLLLNVAWEEYMNLLPTQTAWGVWVIYFIAIARYINMWTSFWWYPYILTGFIPAISCKWWLLGCQHPSFYQQVLKVNTFWIMKWLASCVERRLCRSCAW